MAQTSPDNALKSPAGGAWVRGKSARPAEPPPAPGRLTHLLGEAGWFFGALAAVALFFILATYTKLDPGFSHATANVAVANLGGRLGAWLADILLLLLGLSAWWLVAGMLMWVVFGFRRLHRRATGMPLQPVTLPGWARGAGFVLLLGASAGLESLRLHSLTAQLPDDPGGILGDALAHGLAMVLGFTGATVLLIALIAVGLSLFVG
ncbi:MAG: DNA translocase FtsK 4TM domain-containing protein, partial [Burkholderiaceae bacterium]